MLNILYATDGSPSALGAARFLSHLPHPQSVHLHLLTVRPSSKTDNDEEGERILTDAQSSFVSFTGQITKSIRYAESTTPDIIATIVEEAKDRTVDMIALGICGRSAISRFFVGSVAAGVVPVAPCPVLLACPVVGEAFDHVVVGFDGSPDAITAAEWLPRFPLSEYCILHLLSVVLPPPLFVGSAGLLLHATGEGVGNLVDRDRERIMAAAETMVAKLRAGGITAKIVTEVQENRDAASALVNAARGCQSDLIVVGSRGTTGLEHFLMGSVSEYVLHHAPCSVLIVRSPTHK